MSCAYNRGCLCMVKIDVSSNGRITFDAFVKNFNSPEYVSSFKHTLFKDSAN